MMYIKTLLAAFSLLQLQVLALPASNLEERQSTSCAPLIHFHAAGTSENGLGIVGNALARDLPKAVPGAVVRAINYDTSAEYFITVRAGASTAASVISQAAAQCPNAKISYSGYSKGALVVHSTQLSASVQSKMVSIALFGDPNQRSGNQAVPLNNGNCLIRFCNTGDPFCAGGGNIGAHLAYASDGSTSRASAKIASCYANPAQ
ncbi:carbohydrate esterase family 5 protein [Cystobasidium minutum MCA 4210]|uniref:carbohydrate esterase family 5 protein n=1 Tax=Cystobasidium minutum MCA 4210 TaxID=1397322 RepID=UPI0034CD161F|eukprot:jgi/Rhomi1/78580/CE78579_498